MFFYGQFSDATGGARPSSAPFNIGTIAGESLVKKYNFFYPKKEAYSNDATIFEAIKKGKSATVATYFTAPGKGHIVSVIGYYDGNWIVNDPAGDRNQGG